MTTDIPQDSGACLGFGLGLRVDYYETVLEEFPPVAELFSWKRANC